MGILVDKNSKVIVQGLTGKAGTFHAKACSDYGTKIVAGVTPGKGGTIHEGWPIFNTVLEAKEQTGANVSLIFVPASRAPDAILEAIDAEIELIVVITEGIPVLDMVKIKQYALRRNARIIGPNCPGVITPGEAKVGIMPGHIHKPGGIGVISRSGTLTYEAVYQLSNLGVGQSTCVGIGGDPVVGSSFVDILTLFRSDPNTEAILLIGEIGGDDEIKAAHWVKDTGFNKPVFAFLAGASAPRGKRMGHAGAIIQSEEETVSSKTKKLEALGIQVITNVSKIGSTVLERLKVYG
ncbi:MAG: succinate--CoA ligase subunit alpha [Deltaproteobacteria bacterium]|nr:succinate--CoA ligase subunit alpha [Deltaproteobacteria bacterium]